MEIKAYNPFFNEWIPIVGEYEGYDGNTHFIYGSKCIDYFGRLLNNRIKDNHQNNLLYVGETGSGKSTCAIQICKAQDKKWSIKDNYIYTIEDLQKKYRNPDNFSKISLIDEASIILNSLDILTKDSKKIVGLLDTMRSQGFSNHMCAPDICEINSRVRNVHIDFLLKMPFKSHIPGVNKKGQVDIYRHVRRDWGKDAWQLMATCIFKKLLPKINREYLQCKEEKQRQIRINFTEGS